MQTSTTTDRVSVTAAELAFILSSIEEQRRDAISAVLGLGPDRSGEAVLQAGFSSLLLRGFVAAAEGTR